MELAFNIGQIFSTDTRNGVLGKSEAKKYYIAPYQRGYKWSAATINSPVNLLMSDVKDAFENNESQYYLQYITVKTSLFNGNKVLEVIDGQQRLTTLTLLFSILAYRTNKPEHAIANHLLAYEVRNNVSNFFTEYVYNGIGGLISQTWEEFSSRFPHYDEQDIYYLFQAAQKINELLPPENKLEDFHKYVCSKVLLILNNIESKISCEQLFGNLNSNKVELTNAELIKGLLLTKTAREKDTDSKKRPFKEITELRATMGRQWDVFAHWANTPEINSFYFNNATDPIGQLLELLGIKQGYLNNENNQDKYSLFNFFQSKIKRNEKTAGILFAELKELQAILNDWFMSSEIYNLLGYLFFAKKSIFKLSNNTSLLTVDKGKLKKELKEEVKKLIPLSASDIEYGDDNIEVHRVLLALSIFIHAEKFNFHSFQSEKWSLEHIFPQTPDLLPQKIGVKDISLINTLIGDRLEKFTIDPSDTQSETLKQSLTTKLKAQAECELSAEEKSFLKKNKLMHLDKLNAIGNMALLSSSDNSSNSNGMFDWKRHNIVKRVSNGSFVPKHTYDVFSKLISKNMNSDLTIWTETDIDAHALWVSEKLDTINKSMN